MNMPPRSAHREARSRHQEGLENQDPGTLTINGREFTCSVIKSDIRPETDPLTMVTSTIQTAVVHVRRSLLPQCPGTGARMLLDGLEWFVEALGEQNTTDVTWKLSLKRTITKAAS